MLHDFTKRVELERIESEVGIKAGSRDERRKISKRVQSSSGWGSTFL
jgi:hypothetical protein